jgi:hypothetical protein
MVVNNGYFFDPIQLFQYLGFGFTLKEVRSFEASHGKTADVVLNSLGAHK